MGFRGHSILMHRIHPFTENKTVPLVRHPLMAYSARQYVALYFKVLYLCELALIV